MKHFNLNKLTPDSQQNANKNLKQKKKRQQKNTASSVENCPIFIPDF